MTCEVVIFNVIFILKIAILEFVVVRDGTGTVFHKDILYKEVSVYFYAPRMKFKGI